MDTSSNSPERGDFSRPMPSSTEINERKDHLRKFILSVPRELSPSVFTNGRSQRSVLGNSSNEQMEQFNWSIDQLARLNPVEFSVTGHGVSFDTSIEMALKKESDEYFAASSIVPSPAGPVATEVFFNENNSNLCNVSYQSHCTRLTPSRSIDAGLSKVPTPVSNSRGKQKKKLFAEDRNHFSFDTLEEENSQDANVLQSSNIKGYEDNLNIANMNDCTLNCSPIIGNTSVMSVDEEETMEQDTFAQMSTAMASLDSGCETAKSAFFKTSTPYRLRQQASDMTQD